MSDQVWSSPCRIWLSSGLSWSKVDRSSPPTPGQIWPTPGRFSPTLAELGPDSVDPGPSLAKLAEVGRWRPQVGRNRHTSCRVRANLADLKFKSYSLFAPSLSCVEHHVTTNNPCHKTRQSSVNQQLFNIAWPKTVNAYHFRQTRVPTIANASHVHHSPLPVTSLCLTRCAFFCGINDCIGRIKFHRCH